MNTEPVYQERGSGRIGRSMLLSWNATGLAKFQFYEDHIFLSIWPKKVSLRFEEIDSIEVVKSIYMIGGIGIKINHHSKVSPFVLWWANNPEKIMNLFRERGITVKKTG